MVINLEEYFKMDESGKEGFYYDKDNTYKLKSVDKTKDKDKTRIEKAVEQANTDKRPIIPLSKVYSYINEFLECIREDNGFTEKNIKIDFIELDGKEHLIIDNGIIIRDNNWISSKKDQYDPKYDPKYDVIKDKFNLESVSDLLWFKFTNKGHLAVVASGYDINWDDNNSCGILVNEVKERLDDSFVFVFPLTRQMMRTKSKPELELAVGNYLIYKGVPIIDYFSHMAWQWNDDFSYRIK